MKTSFTVIGLPKPQARPRVHRFGNRIVTHSPKTDWFNLVYFEALKHRGKTILTGPLKMNVRLVLPYPQSMSKKKRETQRFVSVRPDLDNYVKAILDAVNNAQLWGDDGQVSSLYVEKVYGEPARAEIQIEEITGV